MRPHGKTKLRSSLHAVTPSTDQVFNQEWLIFETFRTSFIKPLHAWSLDISTFAGLRAVYKTASRLWHYTGYDTLLGTIAAVGNRWFVSVSLGPFAGPSPLVLANCPPTSLACNTGLDFPFSHSLQGFRVRIHSKTCRRQVGQIRGTRIKIKMMRVMRVAEGNKNLKIIK